MDETRAPLDSGRTDVQVVERVSELLAAQEARAITRDVATRQALIDGLADAAAREAEYFRQTTEQIDRTNARIDALSLREEKHWDYVLNNTSAFQAKVWEQLEVLHRSNDAVAAASGEVVAAVDRMSVSVSKLESRLNELHARVETVERAISLGPTPGAVNADRELEARLVAHIDERLGDLKTGMAEQLAPLLAPMVHKQISAVVKEHEIQENAGRDRVHRRTLIALAIGFVVVCLLLGVWVALANEMFGTLTGAFGA